MQDEEIEFRRRNCFKGLLLQNPARLQHWEEMDLGCNMKHSEHESREVQNKITVHGIVFQHHIAGASMGIPSPWTMSGWQREGESLLQPCSDPAQGGPVALHQPSAGSKEAAGQKSTVSQADGANRLSCAWDVQPTGQPGVRRPRSEG